MKSNQQISLTAGLLLALSPTALLAQALYATAVLYEIQENINCYPGKGTAPDCSDSTAKGFGVRIADATLRGKASGGFSGEFTGELTVEASSILSRSDWVGPAHGKFRLTNMEGKTLFGAFSGQLNLASAILSDPPVPIAPISGHWTGTKGTLKAGGAFSGIFLIPFACVSDPSGACYLELDPNGMPTGGQIPLGLGEYMNGIPLVKLLGSFFAR